MGTKVVQGAPRSAKYACTWTRPLAGCLLDVPYEHPAQGSHLCAKKQMSLLHLSPSVHRVVLYLIGTTARGDRDKKVNQQGVSRRYMKA